MSSSGFETDPVVYSDESSGAELGSYIDPIAVGLIAEEVNSDTYYADKIIRETLDEPEQLEVESKSGYEDLFPDQSEEFPLAPGDTVNISFEG